MTFLRRFAPLLVICIVLILGVELLASHSQLFSNGTPRLWQSVWNGRVYDAPITPSQPDSQLDELQDYLTQRALAIDAARQQRLAYSDLKGAALRVQIDTIRAAFIDGAAMAPHEKLVADVTRVQVAEENSYRLERVAFKNALGLSVHGLLAVPQKCVPSCPVLIAPNGWSSTPEAVMGYGVQDYQHAFGKKFAEAGYIVFAVNLPFAPQDPARTASIESHTAMLASLSAARYWTYLRIEPVLGALDFVETLAEADLARVAVFGISAGGEAALQASVMDSRIGAIVVSGVNVLTPRREMLLETRRFVYSQMYDWNAFALPDADELLVALYPRPVCVELGIYDSTGDFASALAAAERAQGAYQNEARGDNFRIVTHNQNTTADGHETQVQQCLDFVNQVFALQHN